MKMLFHYANHYEIDLVSMKDALTSADGITYISISFAAREARLTPEYLARLCREGKVQARRVGNVWFLDKSSLDEFLVQKEFRRELDRRPCFFGSESFPHRNTCGEIRSRKYPLQYR